MIVVVVVVEMMMKNQEEGASCSGAIKCDYCSKRISLGLEINNGISLVYRSCYMLL